jgi:CheY-like chemotaxis protein
MSQYALIADPDTERAALYAAILKQEGFHPIVAKDADAAVTMLLDRGPPVLAVVDLSVGLDLLYRLRRAASTNALPIIAVSALRTERDLATSHRARLGLGAILAKAASDESFRRVARRLLGIASSDEAEGPVSSPMPASQPTGVEPPGRTDSGVRRRADSMSSEGGAAQPLDRIKSRR